VATLRRPILLVALGLAVAALVAVAAILQHESRTAPVVPILAAPVASPEIARDNPRAEQALPSERIARVAEEVLAAHWGSEWARVREIYRRRGIDLTKQYVVLPWEEAAPHVEAEYYRATDLHVDAYAKGLVRWPEDREAVREWVNGKLGIERTLTAGDLSVIESIAREHNALLQAVSDDCASMLRNEIDRRWKDGRFFKSPIATYGKPNDAAFFSASVGSHGWGVSVSFDADECWGLNEAQDEAKRLRKERDQAIRQYLSW
jgi:hypothetical protein